MMRVDKQVTALTYLWVLVLAIDKLKRDDGLFISQIYMKKGQILIK